MSRRCKSPCRVAASRPHLLRRGPLEAIATAIIALGVVMLLQPFALTLYTWSFVDHAGRHVMFIIVSKFPE